MARLPTRDDLSGPASLRSGRMISSANTGAIGAGMQQFGAEVMGLGNRLEANALLEKRNKIALEGTSADGSALKDLNDLERSFDQDGDYGTFQKRAEEGISTIRNKWASTISDPQAREVWSAEFDKSALGARNRILTLSEQRTREDGLVKAKSGLEGYQSIIADDKATPEMREQAKASAAASIAALQESGALSPATADEWRRSTIEGGEFILAEREIAKNPEAITGKLPAKVADRAGMAMSFFQGKGYTKEQAAGIVGNLLAESSLQPSGAVGDNGTAFGIAQWRGERLTRLKRFAAATGKDWQDFGTQLEYVDMELQNHETSAYKALKAATTVDEATAAFISYERPQGWTPGNPRGGHNYKGRLTYAAQAAGETVRPDWYTNQSPEKQLQLEQQASARQRQMDAEVATQSKAQQVAANDGYRLRIATADPTLTREMILADPAIDDGDKATLINSYNEKMKDEIATAEAVRSFASGGLRVDPYDETGGKTVDNVYSAVSKAAPDQVQPLAEELVRQTGTVPKQIMSLLRQGLSSMDAAAVTEAAQAAQRISTINPAALSRRGGGAEVQRAADDFNFYVGTLNMTPEDAGRRIMEAQNPEKVRARAALEPAAKEFKKVIEQEDIGALFDDSWFSDPKVGFTPGAEYGIKADYLAIAENEFFRANGDPDLAKARADAQMKRLYGVTRITGSPVVMKHPPELYWPAVKSGGMFGGSDPIGYARDQLVGDIKARDPEFDEGAVQLVTTPETDREVRAGQMPGYQVFWKDKNGNYQTLPGVQWRPDMNAIKPELDKRKQDAEADRSVTVDRARELDTQIREGRDREQTLDNFLDGNPLTGRR